MSPITLELLRKRAEHNGGIVATLEEVALHGQDIERIELLGHACRELRILYLQNNVIGRIEHLHRLKQLEYLNLALNNITEVTNLAGCEALSKLDLSANFIASPAGLLSIASLAANTALRELFLTGNPCCADQRYRPFVVASLPQLARLDGVDITPSERIAAQKVLHTLRDDIAAQVNDTREPQDDTRWGPAARLREHREDAAAREAAEQTKRKEAARLLGGTSLGDAVPKKPLRQQLDPLPDDGTLPAQCNEGGWRYTLDDWSTPGCVTLTVWLGRYTSGDDVSVDVTPQCVRVLLHGRMLCIHAPEDVIPSAATCQRSEATGALVVTMATVSTSSVFAVGGPHRSGDGGPTRASCPVAFSQSLDQGQQHLLRATGFVRARPARHTVVDGELETADEPPALCA